MTSTAFELRADTRFSGKCGDCGRWCSYRPLPGGYPPRHPYMNVTCRTCGARVSLAADAGQSQRQPLIISRGELDLSQLRRHCREEHRHASIMGMPRSNVDLASWHFNQHHRYGSRAHAHFGPYVLIADRHGRTVGQIARPIGWYTGQDMRTRAELDAEWKAAHTGVQRGTDGTILRGPSLVCGCPLDADCTGQHPGRE